ncbi:MAG: hypothetical protein DLM60_10440, partial [Pseudonocardiales bacterium]
MSDIHPRASASRSLICAGMSRHSPTHGPQTPGWATSEGYSVSRGKHAKPTSHHHLPTALAAVTLAAGGVLAFADSAAAAPLPSSSTAARSAGQADVIALRALGAALSQRGTRYRSGGSGPGGFDCSGLVQWSYRQAGLHLPRTAAAQSRVG